MWTRKGVATLTLSVAALTAGVALGSHALVAMGGIGLVAIAASLSSTSAPRLRVERRVSQGRANENEPIRVELDVESQEATPLLLQLADELPSTWRLHEGHNDARLAIPPRGRATHAYTATAPIRGHYLLERALVRTQDPLALRSHPSEHRTSSRVTILPGTQDLRKIGIKTRYPLIFLGPQVVRAPGQGMEFFGLREYLPGDPLKEVNWKASVRSSGLVVNQREKETVANVTIIVDAREHMGYGQLDDNALVWAARAAASLTKFYAQRRDRVRLVTYGDTIHVLHPESGERHTHLILDTLTALRAGGATPVEQAVQKILPRLHRKSPVIIISDLVDDATFVHACGLLRSHAMNTLVLAPRPRGHANDPDIQLLTSIERKLTVRDLLGEGVQVTDWPGDDQLSRILSEAPPA